MPPFHKEMYRDLEFNNLQGALWIMFRESAKTSLAKIKLIHSICYNKVHFLLWVSFDQKKAESNIYDVALEMQTNKAIIQDFGQLFYDDKMNEEKYTKKKSIKEFVTANKIKVKALSTGMSPRGEVYGPYRPDLILLDDIETMKTMVSEPRTKQVTDFIDEIFSGAAGYAKILILANRISNNGSIAYLEDKVKDLDNWVVRDVKVLLPDGTPTWKAKYVLTDEDEKTVNKKILDERLHLISLERKRKTLGITVYNREMMNEPLSDDEREIKLSWLQKRFTDEQIKSKHRNRYITIDVADSKSRHKTDPDYTACTVVDIDAENNWYVVYASRGRYNSPELITRIFWLWETFKPIKIGIEKKSLEDQIMPYIRTKSEETKIYPVVVELKHGGTRKEDRIRGALQGPLEAGKIWFKQDAIDDTESLIAELYDFPRSRKDDLSDGLAYIKQIATRPFFASDGQFMPQLHKEFYEYKKLKNKPRSAGAKIRSL